MQKIRRILPIFTIFFAAGSILFLLLVISIFHRKAESAALHSRQEEDPLAVEASVLPMSGMPSLPVYTVRLSGEELRLWGPDLPDSYTVLFSIDPRTLRSADRDALEKGVDLESIEAVMRFLEDFSS